jgi:hypothetical protein
MFLIVHVDTLRVWGIFMELVKTAKMPNTKIVLGIKI